MKCDDCKYAEWNRTKNGRLHPDKQGRCTISKSVKLPACLIGSWEYKDYGDEINISGRQIERGYSFDKCAYYGRVTK